MFRCCHAFVIHFLMLVMLLNIGTTTGMAIEDLAIQDEPSVIFNPEQEIPESAWNTFVLQYRMCDSAAQRATAMHALCTLFPQRKQDLLYTEFEEDVAELCHDFERNYSTDHPSSGLREPPQNSIFSG